MDCPIRPTQHADGDFLPTRAGRAPPGVLGQQQHPTAPDVEAALQDARDLLAEYRSGRKDALKADRLNPLLEKVALVLDSLRLPSGSERERFWT